MPRKKTTKPKFYTTSSADVRPKPPAQFDTYTTSSADKKPVPPKVAGPRCHSET
ncbi:hypothetical protein LCGC14_1415880 [marine sediment metagenome]|uniref:Uncharacterized protein n=1 Tax=marine sediment metagenome TaxID=412755 RepID=A0A0F9KE16_9ZZZZ